jgi:hypothetical protein
MEDARPLDEVANDLASYNMLYDNTFHARSIHPIIQSCRAARARHGRKPTADLRAQIHHELANEHVRALRAAAETTLPRDFGVVARCVRVERAVKQLLKGARSAPVAALRAATDHDLEAPRHATIVAA